LSQEETFQLVVHGVLLDTSHACPDNALCLRLGKISGSLSESFKDDKARLEELLKSILRLSNPACLCNGKKDLGCPVQFAKVLIATNTCGRLLKWATTLNLPQNRAMVDLLQLTVVKVICTFLVLVANLSIDVCVGDLDEFVAEEDTGEDILDLLSKSFCSMSSNILPQLSVLFRRAMLGDVSEEESAKKFIVCPFFLPVYLHCLVSCDAEKRNDELETLTLLLQRKENIAAAVQYHDWQEGFMLLTMMSTIADQMKYFSKPEPADDDKKPSGKKQENLNMRVSQLAMVMFADLIVHNFSQDQDRCSSDVVMLPRGSLRALFNKGSASSSASSQSSPTGMLLEGFDLLEDMFGWSDVVIEQQRKVLATLANTIQNLKAPFFQTFGLDQWKTTLNIMFAFENFFYFSPPSKMILLRVGQSTYRERTQHLYKISEKNMPRHRQDRHFRAVGVHLEQKGSCGDTNLAEKVVGFLGTLIHHYDIFFQTVCQEEQNKSMSEEASRLNMRLQKEMSFFQQTLSYFRSIEGKTKTVLNKESQVRPNCEKEVSEALEQRRLWRERSKAMSPDLVLIFSNAPRAKPAKLAKDLAGYGDQAAKLRVVSSKDPLNKSKHKFKNATTAREYYLEKMKMRKDQAAREKLLQEKEKQKQIEKQMEEFERVLALQKERYEEEKRSIEEKVALEKEAKEKLAAEKARIEQQERDRLIEEEKRRKEDAMGPQSLEVVFDDEEDAVPDKFQLLCTACKEPLQFENIFEKDGSPYCEKDFRSLFCSCHECGKAVQSDDSYITIDAQSNGERDMKKKSGLLGKDNKKETIYYHQACLKCSVCRCSLHVDSEGASDSALFEGENQIFCKTHYMERFGKKCAKCDTYIEKDPIHAIDQWWHLKCFCCKHCDKSLQFDGFRVPDNEEVAYYTSKLFSQKSGRDRMSALDSIHIKVSMSSTVNLSLPAPPPGSSLPPAAHPTLPTPPGAHPTLPTPPGAHPTLPTPPGAHPTLPTPPGAHPTLPISLTTPNQPHPTLPTPPGAHPTLPIPPASSASSALPASPASSTSSNTIHPTLPAPLPGAGTEIISGAKILRKPNKPLPAIAVSPPETALLTPTKPHSSIAAKKITVPSPQSSNAKKVTIPIPQSSTLLPPAPKSRKSNSVDLKNNLQRHPFCDECFASCFKKQCPRCNEQIYEWDDGIRVGEFKVPFHTQCYYCALCEPNRAAEQAKDDKQAELRKRLMAMTSRSSETPKDANLLLGADDTLYCKSHFVEKFAPKKACQICQGDIHPENAPGITVSEKDFHIACTRCFTCQVSLSDGKTQCYIHNPSKDVLGFYCEEHYKLVVSPPCSRCSKPIATGGMSIKGEKFHEDCIRCKQCNCKLQLRSDGDDKLTLVNKKTPGSDTPKLELFCALHARSLQGKAPQCPQCSQKLSGKVVAIAGSRYHVACFQCFECKKSFDSSFRCLPYPDTQKLYCIEHFPK